MRDIAIYEDIHQLVKKFYLKVKNDDLLAVYFEHINWDEHIPKMEQFWRFAILDEAGYTTNVTEKHLKMKLNKPLFDRWIKLFNETIDQNFKGNNAEKAKSKAFQLGWTMQSKFTD